MKSIDLTKKHKSKLLEMCKKLFSEYYYMEIQGQNILFLKEKYIGEFCIDESFMFHWFEFCITHLIQRIFPDETSTFFGNPSIKSNCIRHYDIIIHAFAGYPNEYYSNKPSLKNFHIIDYLYEEFKKLKNFKNNKNDTIISNKSRTKS